MFKSVKELQEFIIWAKSQKLKSFKNNEIEFELSELGLLPESELEAPKTYGTPNIGDLPDSEKLDPQEEEDLLMWSAE